MFVDECVRDACHEQYEEFLGVCGECIRVLVWRMHMYVIPALTRLLWKPPITLSNVVRDMNHVGIAKVQSRNRWCMSSSSVMLLHHAVYRGVEPSGMRLNCDPTIAFGCFLACAS